MIPVSEPALTEVDRRYLLDAFDTGWISSAGRYIDAFEGAWAQYCGMDHGIAVSSGTTALQLAVQCLDLSPGDEVILPTFTIISCAQAVAYAGLVPVLVDSDPQTWCMDVAQVEAKITPRTRAIMAVHIYGHPVDLDPLQDICRRHGLVLIEDAAEAHAAQYLSRIGGQPQWRPCGGIGDISIFSFYANKLITTGEGGMVLTRSASCASRLRSLRDLAFQAGRRFYHSELGYNFRMTNMQAALGYAQVQRIQAIVDRKRWMGSLYNQRLQGVTGLQLPTEAPWARQVYWMYGLVIDEATGLSAETLAARLREHGVDTRPFFLGMHEQPALLNKGFFAGERYPVAERLARQGLYLPSGLTLTESQIDAVSNAVRESIQ
jgi:perosamine synthetase